MCLGGGRSSQGSWAAGRRLSERKRGKENKGFKGSKIGTEKAGEWAFKGTRPKTFHFIGKYAYGPKRGNFIMGKKKKERFRRKGRSLLGSRCGKVFSHRSHRYHLTKTILVRGKLVHRKVAIILKKKKKGGGVKM